MVMVLGDWQFRAMHIPGSLNISAPEIAHELLHLDDEIVVYCSNPACAASVIAFNQLTAHGYKNVRRYAGGISDWEESGYPVEGEMVK
jgi:rhodanese-related sulfurtransferase